MSYDIAQLLDARTWEIEFDTTRVVFGPGAVDRLGELTREAGTSRAMIVTTPEVRQAGHVERALTSLAEASIETAVFEDVPENPTTRDVEHGTRFASKHLINGLIALGGGSAMDCARGINFLLTQGGRLEDYWGVGKATKPMLRSIGVPTTAGTGSDAQSFALIAQEGTHQKMACGDRKAKFGIAILDPELSLTMPREVTAISGIDAVSHAVESYVSRRSNPFSRIFAREAWQLLERTLPRVLEQPDDIDARGRMLIAAHLAGLAVEHSMLGAAHACANPLTARFGVTHGIAVGLMLPPTIRFNESEVAGQYRELHRHSESTAVGQSLYERVCQLRSLAALPEALRDYRIPRDRLPDLAAEAAQQWTARFNPRPVGTQELLELYETAY